MITSATTNAVAANVITDANANVQLPVAAPRTISAEFALLLNKSIVARALGVPEVCAVGIKNTEYRYRWVNRDGQGGRIYMQRRAQGFTNATESDVDVHGGDVIAKDGEIRAGDLILMKIQADKYDAAIKWNMQKADTLARTRGVMQEGGSSDVMSDATPRRVSVSEQPYARNGQAPAFIPTNAEALVNESITSGRAEATRAVVDELRHKGAAKVEV